MAVLTFTPATSPLLTHRSKRSAAFHLPHFAQTLRAKQTEGTIDTMSQLIQSAALRPNAILGALYTCNAAEIR
eukprot:scaffold457134_cov45-Prasinocladus_malaysianus.AAC.1